MPHLPFPSNENALDSAKQALAESTSNSKPPWKQIKPNEQPPNMFQVHRNNGNIISYSYCDLRETRLLSAGYLQLLVYGMEKYLITIEGRHLNELATLIGMCRIRSLEELGQRTFVRPETCPAIDKISIEELTGAAPY